jgi:hypothetical protein
MQTSCQPKTSRRKTVDNVPPDASARRKNEPGEGNVRTLVAAAAQSENSPHWDAVGMVATEDCRQDIERQY